MDENTDSIIFFEEWLTADDYELKILVLTSVLAENNLAYRGTLADLRRWLGLSSSTPNNNNIKNALVRLEEKGYVKTIIDGRTYTISISEKGIKENKKLQFIKKAWIRTIKEYKNEAVSISWISMLRVFVYILTISKSIKPITQKEIASALELSEASVGKAINIICSTNFDDLKIERDVIKENYGTSEQPLYRTIGTVYRVWRIFE